MNFEDFRIRGKQVIDFVCNLSCNIEGKRVLPDVEPGYLSQLIPEDAPRLGDSLEEVLRDVEEKILPGMTLMCHPGFHAYHPMGRGSPSLIGDILIGGIGCVSSSWISSPACTELETIVLDWLGKAMSIPPHFIYSSPGSIGGGVIQSSTGDCILPCLLAARAAAIKYLKESASNAEREDSFYLSKLVAYTSREAHASVERSAHIAMVKLRVLETDEQCSLRGPTLADAVHLDQDQGLHPFFVACTLGTPATCGFDNLKEIGPIVKKLPQCWLHVDGSYVGCGFICPELRYLKEGMEFADSFNVNCSKWLTITQDCSCLWVKDRYKLTRGLVSDSFVLQSEQPGVDYCNWGVQLSRRFTALKLWLTFRLSGLEALQTYVRNHCKLAKEFEKIVSRDSRFEVVNDVRVGIVCFRLIGSDRLNQELLASINKEGKVHMTPARVQNEYALRFCVAHPNATQAGIDASWNVIQRHATEVLDREHGEKLQCLSEYDRKKFSFVQAITPDVYEKRRTRTLTHGTGPLYVTASQSDTRKSSEDPFEVFHDVRSGF